MKWNEMSAFHKILTVICGLCLAACLYLLIFYAFGLLPGVYELHWAQFLFGVSWGGMAILNWKKMRIVAILDLVTAILAFVAAFLGWFVK